MNARGTRRPHAKRVRSKPVRMKRGGGGGGKKTSGCGLFLFALISLPAIAVLVTR
jgi:hypothetical protein